MKVVQINATCEKGSTGRICVGISKVLTDHKIENYILYSTGETDYPLGIKCSNEKYIKGQALKSRVLGNYGFNSNLATRKIIKELKQIDPAVVHLHNIHGHDCNVEMLFDYLKINNIKVIWTFHDCWAFTGYCTHFTLSKCEKWKKECNDCIQYKKYSWFKDKSRVLHEKKMSCVRGLDLTIVTPSTWLSDIVKTSFMKECPVIVINNGIDLDLFKPINDSSFRKRYNISEDKKIILGVAFGWGYAKGLDVFIDLATRLDCEEYQIVLVGTDKEVDRELPPSILSIHRTYNQEELIDIYTAADVFVNPTREDNYPTVNMEAVACGTPVITFRTGGSPEMLDETCGAVVECNDLESLMDEIVRFCNYKNDVKEMCLNRAQEFNEREKFKEYLKLYERVDVTGNQGD